MSRLRDMAILVTAIGGMMAALLTGIAAIVASFHTQQRQAAFEQKRELIDNYLTGTNTAGIVGWANEANKRSTDK